MNFSDVQIFLKGFTFVLYNFFSSQLSKVLLTLTSCVSNEHSLFFDDPTVQLLISIKFSYEQQ